VNRKVVDRWAKTLGAEPQRPRDTLYIRGRYSILCEIKSRFCSFEKACQPVSKTRNPLNAVRKRSFHSVSQKKARETDSGVVVDVIRQKKIENKGNAA
jgi:hypothetical protein